MKPGALLAAAAELLEQIDTNPNQPADSVCQAYVRHRRYIGARDRKLLLNRVYQALRYRRSLDWWLDHIRKRNHLLQIDRFLAHVITLAVMAEKLPITTLQDYCNGERFHPPPLSHTIVQALQSLSEHDLCESSMPDGVRWNIPECVLATLQEHYGHDFSNLAEALLQTAPIDLRINTLKTDRDRVLALLHQHGFTADATPFSPWGIRVAQRSPDLERLLITPGLAEFQDEGSQIAALLADPRPGHAVLDLCAGAGGKTLALAAMMQNKGRIIATDIAKWRLDKATVRLRRAGVHNVTCRALDRDTERWLDRQQSRFDRVLIDAPCSGTGTWRRNPDQKWRITEESLERLLATQKQLLTQAAAWVKPGGLLIYVTCSLLPQENDQHIAELLASDTSLTLIKQDDNINIPVESSTTAASFGLQLTPKDHNTDGFYIATLRKN